MKNLLITLTTAVFALSMVTVPARAGDEAVLAQLAKTKISLLDGIKQAERGKAVVISAKFELDDNGKLSLSIYTAPQGLDVPAETNPLTELSGDPTVTPFAPAAEVFADKEHIARASTHLAILQLSEMSLTQIIKEAMEEQEGTPYSVANPMIRDHRAVADVFILNKQGKSVRVSVDVQNCDAQVRD